MVAVSPIARPGTPLSKSPIRVLVVDDNQDLASAYALLIGLESDLEWVGALNRADNLLGEVERRRPHVVVLDLTMPGRDPLEAMAEVRRQLSDVHFIAFSGYDDDATRRRSLEAGAKMHVAKSDNPHAIIDAVRTLMAATPAAAGTMNV